MRFDKTVLLTAFIALSASLTAQTHAGESMGQTPLLETSLGYTFLHANAPPGQCGCFSANGGYGSVVYNLPRGFAIVADLGAVHASNIAGTNQSITVFNYLFGPRYNFHQVSGRIMPYAQALGGGSRETSSYAAVQDVNGAAFSLGGGITMPIDRHFAWTIMEADWIQSRLPNAQNNLQNDFRIGGAMTFRMGSR
jgi:hypothetical protein